MRLLLIDGTNIVMRFAFAMVPGADVADHPAVLAQLPQILGAVEKAIWGCAAFVKTPYVVVALDSGESWRRDVYPEYKAGRKHATLTWTNRLNAHLDGVGIKTARSFGFEGDDVIATLVARAARAGHQTAVLSSDTDMLMLASTFCDVYQFGKKGEARYVLRDMEWVRKKYELQSVGQLAAYKALVGEQGDNLPGLLGVGPVKARRMLGHNMTVSHTALAPHDYERYALMLKLVTLRDDAPVDLISPAACRLGKPLIQEAPV
jgi:DNA polymerase-1